MSSASTTRTIKFVSKAGTYTALISCPQGDIYQEWVGSTGDVSRIYPDFISAKPVLYFVCTSSRVAEGVATPDSMTYYFNGTVITFGNDGVSTGVLDGMFKKVTPSGDNLYHGLQILQNLVVASGYAPAVIKMVAHVSYGTQTDDIQASYTIPIQQSTGNSYRVTIAAGDNKNFVITEKGGSCKLKCMVYQGGAEKTLNLSYKWEKMGPTGWVLLNTQTAKEITVQADDINTYGEYRATAFINNEEVGSDIQGVMDASDPYDIDPHPSPEDETITEDASGNGQVTYTPVVVTRGTNTQALTTNFFFVVKDAAGNILNVGEAATARSSCTVTRAQCMQAGGDVSVTITAQN